MESGRETQYNLPLSPKPGTKRRKQPKKSGGKKKEGLEEGGGIIGNVCQPPRKEEGRSPHSVFPKTVEKKGRDSD